MKENRTFSGTMDFDSALDSVKPGDYLFAVNIINGSFDGTNIGRVRNRKGTTLVCFDLPTGLNKCIGSIPDKPNQKIYGLFYNSNSEHSILEYTVRTNTTTKVSQGIFWNFSFDSKITTGDVFGGFLSFAEITNPPRLFNIQKAINYTNGLTGDKYNSMDSNTVSMIKFIPSMAPVLAYNTVPRDTNFVRGNLYQGAYKYIFESDMESCFSNYSVQPLPETEEYVTGNWIDSPPSINNCITFTAPIEFPYLVKGVKFIARLGNIENGVITGKGRWFVINTQKISEGQNLATFDFFNDQVHEVLDPAELNNYDNVPIRAGRQRLVLGEHMVYGDIEEGFDNPVPVVTLEVKHSIKAVEFPTENVAYSDWNNNPSRDFNLGYSEFGSWGWRWIINYKRIFQFPSLVVAGKIYTINVVDKNGAVYTFAINSSSYPTLPSMAQLMTDLVTGINVLIPASSPAYGKVEYESPQIGGIQPSTIVFSTSKETHYEDPIGFNPINVIGNYISLSSTITINSATSVKYPSEKRGQNFSGGLLYKDEAGRSSGVVPIPDLVIPYCLNTWPVNYISQILFKIYHQPPDWAYTYNFVRLKDPNLDKYVQFICKKITKITDGVTFDVNTNIRLYKKVFGKSIIPEWSWVKGDRIRVTAYQDGLNWTSHCVSNNEVLVDKEIIDIVHLSITDLYKEAIPDAFNVKNNADSVDSSIENTVGAVSAGLGATFGSFKTEDFDFPSHFILENENYFIVEVYRPKKNLEHKLYYDFGEEYNIIDPTLPTRRHQGQSGTLQWNIAPTHAVAAPSTDQSTDYTIPATGIFKRGNCYLKNRVYPAAFPIEERNYSDFYISDSGDYGREWIIVENMKRQRLTTKLISGEKFIESTYINRINKFTGESTLMLPLKYGGIVGLEEAGYTLKSIHKNKCTSIDIARQTLKTGTGSDLVTYTGAVLGNERPTESSYGSIHDSGIISTARYIYFFDINNGVVIRDSANGEFLISSYKAVSHFKDIAAKLSKHDTSECLAGFDSAMEELVMTFYGYLSATIDPANPAQLTRNVIFYNEINFIVDEKVLVYEYNENGSLIEEYNLIVISFDGVNVIVGSGFGALFMPNLKYTYKIRKNFETCVFSELKNGWTTTLKNFPEYLGSVGQTFVEYNKGQLSIRNNNPVRNLINGVQESSMIRAIFNAQSIKDKIFKTLSYIGLNKWWCPSITVEPSQNFPSGQRSRLRENKIVQRGTIFYAPLMNDMNTPNMTNETDALINGIPLQGRVITVDLQNDSTTQSELFEVEVGGIGDLLT